MKCFVEGEDRRQTILLPDCVDDYVTEENPVRAVEAFVDALDLAALGFAGVVPETTGRPCELADSSSDSAITGNCSTTAGCAATSVIEAAAPILRPSGEGGEQGGGAVALVIVGHRAASLRP